MLGWGMGGRQTSNSEYGRGVLASSMLKASAASGTSKMNNGSSFSSQMGNFPGSYVVNPQGTMMNYSSGGQAQDPNYYYNYPGHVHQPGCPNAHSSSTNNQNQAQYALNANQTLCGSGVFETGGNAGTDFKVYIGDAAAAVLGQSNQAQMQAHNMNPYQYQYNYYMPQSSNVSEGGNPGVTGMNYQCQQESGGDHQVQGQDDPHDSGSCVGSTTMGQDQISNNPQTPCQAEGQGQSEDHGTGDATSGGNAGMMPTKNFAEPSSSQGQGQGSYKPLRRRVSSKTIVSSPTTPSDFQHIYSSLRPKKGVTPPPFVLCGKCPKCKNLQDPTSVRPSILNMKGQGLLPSGARRFPIPKTQQQGGGEGDNNLISGHHGQMNPVPSST